jgi:hypothetical protein
MSSIHPARPPSVDFPLLLAEFDASGQRAAAFARSRGLAPWRLYHALNRRKARAQLAEARASGARPTMLPVRVVPDTVAARANSGLEVELAGGHRLRIGADFDAELLRRVLGALARC